MFDRLLLFGFAAVAMGMCAGSAAVLWHAARGTAKLWQTVRAPRLCPGCRNLGRRCPWCVEELWRGVITALGIFFPEAAWPVMVWSSIPFTPGVQLATGLWALLHLWLVLSFARPF